MPVNASTGYPTHEDCLKYPFFYYMFSDAVGKGFQNLYNNEQGLCGRFGPHEFVRTVGIRK